VILLVNTTDKLQLVTGTAADIDAHVDFADASQADPPVVQGSMGRQNTAITTATTTDILAAPAASETRKVKFISIRNKDTADSTDVTVVYDQNGTDFDLFKCNLAPGDTLQYIEGVGFFETPATVPGTATNKSTASQAFSTTDAYVTGSNVLVAGLGTPTVGLMYDCSFDMAKTAGTGAMVITVRVGTAGTTADTARLTFTHDAGRRRLGGAPGPLRADK
jgi:hypothetical protein